MTGGTYQFSYNGLPFSPRFTYDYVGPWPAPPTAEEQSMDSAELENRHLPDGREKSLAMTRLEEVMFWSNAAIAREPQPGLEGVRGSDRPVG